jgi:hypothetical protein
MKTVVSIQKLYYGEPITALANSGGLSKDDVTAFISETDTKEVPNVHATTWAYEEDDPTTTDYINQLNDQIYYTDFEAGGRRISFTMGQYEYALKADLKGGKATATGWTAPVSKSIIYKTVVALTRDNTYIIFPKAVISCRTGMVEDKLIGELVTASPLETGIAGMEAEGWFDAA